MAKRRTHVLTDDLDGSDSPGIETIQFGFLGVSYEIDLTERHREEFALAIGRYLHAARPARAKNPRSRTNAQRDRTRAIRAWANEHGHDLPERGRIPAEVTALYWAAHTENRNGEQ